MHHGKQLCRPFAILKIFDRYVYFLSLLIVCSLVMMVVMVVAAIGFARSGWLLTLC